MEDRGYIMALMPLDVRREAREIRGQMRIAIKDSVNSEIYRT
jgi:hypothetical protein